MSLGNDRRRRLSPRGGRGDGEAVQAFGDAAEQRRGDREIEGLDDIAAHQRGKFGPAVIAPGVNGGIADDAQKSAQRVIAAFGRGDEFGDGATDMAAKLRFAHFSARGADDARPFGDLPRQKPPVKAGQDLAPRQIAGAPENDQIERIDGDDA